ncbi:hypothetical protein OIU76_012094 [Salix suchowensis]|nr:hypothetical protein OIU76_012094 [Salix suchowensis]KAJ6324934.1 hypothetical protein OIU76_012094 [Salix suchowensis]
MTNLQACSSAILKIMSSLLILLYYPTIVSCECTCEVEDSQHDKGEALKYKLGSILSILVAGAIGVGLPLLGKKIKTLSPENDIFFMIKAFAAGVILATGFIHILPDAFDSLTSPCLAQKPWGGFPFTGFVAMMTAIGTLMVDSFATGVYKRMHFNRSKPVNTTDEEKAAEEHEGHVHVHTHATHGHAHGSASPGGRFGPDRIDSSENRIASIGAGDCSSFSNYWNLSGRFVESKNNKASHGSLVFPPVF